ncbi:isoflavone reductase P3 [Fusarium albosuccineum]|uniref:Isoflavone reductase P3 n=1 Tax=Fusarium albosuccineum TaxID=1237068 RepID=A0A8H4NXH9_9HYPO|nr:isoflavone reductase P3 [Fusarium albosuccineum]
MKVAIVGASGETGQSIVIALIQSAQDFAITVLVRPESVEKPEIQRLKTHDVEVVSLDLEGPHKELVQALAGQEVVISCVIPFSAETQISLANAAKAAGVKRFVPSAFGPVCPPEGVLILREIKQTVLNHIQKIYLPYTVIDVGWWYQSSNPRLPSGKIDYALKFPVSHLAGDGNLPSALTDLRDIGRYVERIITDPRTLNKSVFVYNEVLTQEQIFSKLEEVSGETIPRDYLKEDNIRQGEDAARARYEQDPSVPNLLGLSTAQYFNSIWLRGDNLPESASYLGYLDGKELYPDFKFVSYSEYAKELVAGKAKGVYMDRVFGFEKDLGTGGQK